MPRRKRRRKNQNTMNSEDKTDATTTATAASSSPDNQRDQESGSQTIVPESLPESQMVAPVNIMTSDQTSSSESEGENYGQSHSIGLDGMDASFQPSTILVQIRSKDPGMQWVGVKNLCDYWAMCNEETLAGFPIQTTLQQLLRMLTESDGAMPELELMIIRSLLNLFELLSPSNSPNLIREFIPLLITRLYSIEYIDLAEACISLLSKLSLVCPQVILSHNGMGALLAYLDFFALTVQRVCVQCVYNLSLKISDESLALNCKDSVSILCGIVRSQIDDKITELASGALANLIESFFKFDKQAVILTGELLDCLIALLQRQFESPATPISIEGAIKSLSLIAKCSSIEIHDKNIGSTVSLLLKRHAYGTDSLVDQLLLLLDLAIALLPETYIDKETGVDGNQIFRNWEIAPNRTNRSLPEPPKFAVFSGKLDNELCNNLSIISFAMDLFPIAIDVYQISSNQALRIRCLVAITRACLLLSNERLNDLLRTIPFANFLARIIGRSLVELERVKQKSNLISRNVSGESFEGKGSIAKFSHYLLLTATYGLGLCKIVLEQLPGLYEVYFRREGLFFELQRLANFDLENLACDLDEYLSQLRVDIQAVVAETDRKKEERQHDSVRPNQPVVAEVSSVSLPIIGRGWRGAEGIERGSTSNSNREGFKALIDPTDPASASSDKIKSESFTLFDLMRRHQALARLYNSSLPIWYLENLKSFTKTLLKQHVVEELEQDTHPALSSLRKAKEYADKLLECVDDTEESEALCKISKLFTTSPSGDADLTSFEMLKSGLADALLSWFSDGDFEGKVLLFTQKMGKPEILELLRLLQKALSRLEAFELETSIFSYSLRRNSSVSGKFVLQLTKPIRLRVKPVEESAPEIESLDTATVQYSPNVPGELGELDILSSGLKSLTVMLPAASSLDTLEEFLLRKLDPYFAKKEAEILKEGKRRQNPSESKSNSLRHQAESFSSEDFVQNQDSTEIDRISRNANRRRNDSSFVHDIEIASARHNSNGSSSNTVDLQKEMPDNINRRLIEFSVGGIVVPANSTIYSVIHRAELQRSAQPSELSLQQNSGFSGIIQSISDAIEGNATITNMLSSGIHTINFRPYLGSKDTVNQSASKTARDDPCFEAVFLSGEKSVIDFLRLPGSLLSDDASSGISKVFLLIKLIHAIAIRFELMHELSAREFINYKLATKINQQLSDIMITSGGLLPRWCADLCIHFPFLLPFETRLLYSQSAYYGPERPIMKWIQRELPRIQARTGGGQQDPVINQLSRISRQKIRIHRDKLFESGIKILKTYGTNQRYMMEIEFFGEEGTGLGPTLEFYSLMSSEWQKRSRQMWRLGESRFFPADNNVEYIQARGGLFPAPRSEVNQTAAESFQMLGRFLAKSMKDYRLVDIHLHPFFIERVVFHDYSVQRHSDGPLEFGPETVNYERLSSVDEDLAKNLDFIRKSFGSYSHDGGASVDSMEIDFSLPGYADYAFPRKFKGNPVNARNVEFFVACVVDATLYRGIDYAVENFRSGFAEVLPIEALRCFTVSEIIDLWSSGAWGGKWSPDMLRESIKTDHGFGAESRTVLWLIEIMSEFDEQQQRLFLQFITGSSKLPIGGFKALSPPLTVVCKTSSSDELVDRYLPSVMTCVNYLKLPDYSSIEIMRDRLKFAIQEGQGSFFLS